MSAAGVPIKLLHEGEGHTVVVELKNGELYRGHLAEAEDNMNCNLTGVVFTARNGQVTKLEHVYLRGSSIRFIVLPEMLKNAPVFKKVSEVAAAKAKPFDTKRQRGAKK